MWLSLEVRLLSVSCESFWCPPSLCQGQSAGGAYQHLGQLTSQGCALSLGPDSTTGQWNIPSRVPAPAQPSTAHRAHQWRLQTASAWGHSVLSCLIS